MRTFLFMGALAPCLLALLVWGGIWIKRHHFVLYGPSMQPQFESGDRFFAIPESHYFPGDVIALRSPYDGAVVIKRVIGIAGDTIDIESDEVVRNGAPIPALSLGETGDGLLCFEETLEGVVYRTLRSAASPPESMPPFHVPNDHVFVMGDHRDRSSDSRRFGFVPLTQVIGRIDEPYHRMPSEFVCPD